MSFVSVNPATGKVIASYQETTPEEIEQRLVRAHRAQMSWRAAGFSERAAAMRRLAHLFYTRRDQLAKIMAEEMGKPVAQGRAEAEKCAWACEYFSEHGPAFLTSEAVSTDFARSQVHFSPLGLVLAVMPWNYPLWQVFRAAVPALMAGNGMILKHASNVSACALVCEKLCIDAGLPEGLFATLLVRADSVPLLIADSRIAAVTVTGSAEAGRSIAALAGAHLKKCVLELGGSDPYVILPDADIANAAKKCAQSRLQNAGQSCVAAKRFIVVRSIAAQFIEKLLTEMRAVSWGDPLHDDTNMGPLARIDLRDVLHSQVEESIAAGARLKLGGEIPDASGAFYPPTLLTEVEPGMPAFDQELFGPVAAVIEAEDEVEALMLANKTQYGLGAAVFTADATRGERICTDRMDAGVCFVNDFVRSDPRLPFGGVKHSGYGRELGVFGIREFVNVKTVVVA